MLVNLREEEVRPGDALIYLDQWCQVIRVIDEEMIFITYDNEHTVSIDIYEADAYMNSYEYAKQELSEEEFKVYDVLESYCHPLTFKQLIEEAPVLLGDAAKLAKMIKVMSGKGFIEFQVTDMFEVEIYTFGHDTRNGY